LADDGDAGGGFGVDVADGDVEAVGFWEGFPIVFGVVVVFWVFAMAQDGFPFAGAVGAVVAGFVVDDLDPEPVDVGVGRDDDGGDLLGLVLGSVDAGGVVVAVGVVVVIVATVAVEDFVFDAAGADEEGAPVDFLFVLVDEVIRYLIPLGEIEFEREEGVGSVAASAAF
jgi:hypothetical protein